MGTASGFYQPFAEELVSHRITALLAELPGTGASRPRPSWKVNYGYRDLVESYLPGLVRVAREIGQGAPVVLMGHSLGAHAGALAVATGSIDIDALVTYAGGNIHYRNWQGVEATKVFLAAGLFSSLSGLFGHLPGQHLGFGGPQARTLIREWSKIIFTGRFSHIYDRMMADPHVPVLCIGFQGDGLAPEKSVAGLAQVLNGETEILPVNWPGNPHSSWARNPVETVSKTDEWLLRRDVLEPG
jgi:predicted alpha/beta hydrolase